MAVWLAGAGALLGLISGGFGGLLIGGVLGYIVSLLFEIRHRLERMESAFDMGRPGIRTNSGLPRNNEQAAPAGALGVSRYPEQAVISAMAEEEFDEQAAEDFDRYYRDVSRPRTRGRSR